MSEDIQKVIEHGEGFLSFGSEKGDRQPTEEGIKLQRSRITSYNVCYTKLLRVKHPDVQ